MGYRDRDRDRPRVGADVGGTDLDYVLGVDLGQAQDYTALALIKRVVTRWVPPEGDIKEESAYHLQLLDRAPLDVLYPVVVRQVVTLLDRPPLSRETPCVVDRSGVGRAVTDMFTEAGIDPYTVTITGGDTVTREGRHYNIPKRDIVGSLIAVYQAGRLKVAKEMELWPQLVHELTNFKLKQNLKTGHDSYESWRESDHDDLVLALGLAVWYAENRPAPIELLDPETADLLQNGWEYNVFD